MSQEKWLKSGIDSSWFRWTDNPNRCQDRFVTAINPLRFRLSENSPISTGLQPWILTVLVGRTARQDRNRRMNRPRCNSIEHISCLTFSMRKHLSFAVRFPPLRKSSKMGSLDMSKNQNGISSQQMLAWDSSLYNCYPGASGPSSRPGTSSPPHHASATMTGMEGVSQWWANGYKLLIYG